MLLKSEINLTDFLKEVTKCNGEVLFETNEGDSLNLKSVLSQYIFAAISGNPSILLNGHVICKDKNDYEVLEDYLNKES
jgi:hypothetical protein